MYYLAPAITRIVVKELTVCRLCLTFAQARLIRSVTFFSHLSCVLVNEEFRDISEVLLTMPRAVRAACAVQKSKQRVSCCCVHLLTDMLKLTITGIVHHVACCVQRLTVLIACTRATIIDLP